MPKKMTEKQKKEKAARDAKKMTVGKALDMLSFGAAGVTSFAQYMEDGIVENLTVTIPQSYSGYRWDTKEWSWEPMVRGYGPPAMRALEKKAFKFLGIRGPRSKIETIGDALDYITYFGKTAVEIYENIDRPGEAARQAVRTQYGIDMSQVGMQAIQPQDMIMEKWLPYYIQKKARQIIRGAGIKLPKLTGG